MRLANLQPGVEPEWPDVDRLGLVRRVPSLDRITSRGGKCKLNARCLEAGGRRAVPGGRGSGALSHSCEAAIAGH